MDNLYKGIISDYEDRQKIKSLILQNMNIYNLKAIIDFINEMIIKYKLEHLHLNVSINTLPQIIFNLFGNIQIV